MECVNSLGLFCFLLILLGKGFGKNLGFEQGQISARKYSLSPQKLLKSNHYCKQLCYGIVTGGASLPQTPLLLALIRAETSNLENCNGSNIKGIAGISSIGKNMRTWIKLLSFASEENLKYWGKHKGEYGAWRRSQRLKIQAVVGMCWGHWQGMGCVLG